MTEQEGGPCATCDYLRILAVQKGQYAKCLNDNVPLGGVLILASAVNAGCGCKGYSERGAMHSA